MRLTGGPGVPESVPAAGLIVRAKLPADAVGISDHAIRSHFEQDFLSESVARQTAGLDSYYLAPRMRDMIPAHQPVLEAGCGSGKWVAWAAARGWQAIGIDWSSALIQRAQREVPRARFIQGDMRKMPLRDASVGSIISLGAIEHAIEGPEASLSEYARILCSGGAALITVPYLGAVRRAVWALRRHGKYSPIVRRLLNRSGGRRGLGQLTRLTRPEWVADFLPTTDGWAFFQYQLDQFTMRRLLSKAGLVVDEEFLFGPEEGLIATFSSAAGRYDPEQGFVLTAFGRVLHRTLRRGNYEHMLGYMVHKP